MRATSSVSTEQSSYDPLGLGRDREGTAVRTSTCSTTTRPVQAYDHVAPLMADIAGDISQADRTALQETLIEYADVFSSGPEDMGLTDQVEHTIDTGDNRPNFAQCISDCATRPLHLKD